MLKGLGKLPRDLTVAVSGGPDSMAILDFLSNNDNVTAAYFDHGNSFGTKCKSFVKDFCDSRDIEFVVMALSQNNGASQGLLGMNFLKHFAFNLDQDKQHLILQPRD